MRWFHCSYADLQLMPEGYDNVAIEIAQQMAREKRAAARSRGRR
jgi:hypothetical protein